MDRPVRYGQTAVTNPPLVLVDRLAADGQLTGYHLLPATRADLLRRLGRHAEAAAEYRTAIELADTDPVRDYLVRRLDELMA